VNPYTNAVVYAVVAIVVLPVMFGLFKTPYTLFDIVLGALAGAATSWIPLVGAPVSLIATVLVLNWRLPASLYPDILLPVFVARLAMIPVMLWLRMK
jgi:hypothetical protein